jgi:hypothetical protein
MPRGDRPHSSKEVYSNNINNLQKTHNGQVPKKKTPSEKYSNSPSLRNKNPMSSMNVLSKINTIKSLGNQIQSMTTNGHSFPSEQYPSSPIKLRNPGVSENSASCTIEKKLEKQDKLNKRDKDNAKSPFEKSTSSNELVKCEEHESELATNNTEHENTQDSHNPVSLKNNTHINISKNSNRAKADRTDENAFSPKRINKHNLNPPTFPTNENNKNANLNRKPQIDKFGEELYSSKERYGAGILESEKTEEREKTEETEGTEETEPTRPEIQYELQAQHHKNVEEEGDDAGKKKEKNMKNKRGSRTILLNSGMDKVDLSIKMSEKFSSENKPNSISKNGKKQGIGTEKRGKKKGKLGSNVGKRVHANSTPSTCSIKSAKHKHSAPTTTTNNIACIGGTGAIDAAMRSTSNSNTNVNAGKNDTDTLPTESDDKRNNRRSEKRRLDNDNENEEEEEELLEEEEEYKYSNPSHQSQYHKFNNNQQSLQNHDQEPQNQNQLQQEHEHQHQHQHQHQHEHEHEHDQSFSDDFEEEDVTFYSFFCFFILYSSVLMSLSRMIITFLI